MDYIGLVESLSYDIKLSAPDSSQNERGQELNGKNKKCFREEYNKIGDNLIVTYADVNGLVERKTEKERMIKKS